MITKSDLVDSMALKTGLTKKDTAATLEAFIEAVGEGLATDGKIQLVGFGAFEARERAARVGRNPKKPGETVDIPAKTSAAFKPGKALKDKLNK